MDIKKLAVFMKENGAPAFRIKQARDAVYKNFAASWDEVPVLPAPLREALHRSIRIHSVDNLETLVSKKGDAVKFCFGLKDDHKIEAVLLNLMPETVSYTHLTLPTNREV